MYPILLFIFLPLTLWSVQIPHDLLRQLLPQNAVVIEAGAQFGEDTAWMSELWKEGTIHAFEPNPSSYQQLAMVASKKLNVKTYPLALADKPGVANFWLAGGASSLLPPREPWNSIYFHVDPNRPIQVQCVTLDEWAQKMGITHVDFLWFDLEGMELNVFKGGCQLLKTVQVIHTEVNFQEFRQGNVQYSQLKAFLKGEGFIPIWQDIAPHWAGNVVFVRPQLAEKHGYKELID